VGIEDNSSRAYSSSLVFDLEQPVNHSYLTCSRQQRVVMNPNTHIILDEIAWRFVDHDGKWDHRFVD
jgi:hypothetical protein